MSVPSATTVQTTIQPSGGAMRLHETADKGRTQSSRGAPAAQDSVSLSTDVKSAYRAQQAGQTDASTRPAAHNDVAELRDLSSEMRRLSSEATQSRATENTPQTADAGATEAGMAAQLSDTLTADDGPQASFTPLSDASQSATPDGGSGGDERPGSSENARSSDATGGSEAAPVDSSASLADLDHALGRISHNKSERGANFDSLTEATRLSVRQRESLAVAHREGGGHELANSAAQVGRPNRLQKVSSAAQTPPASSVRESKTYTRPSRKA